MVESPQRSRSLRVKIVLAFGAIYIVWASTYLAIRIAVQTIPPFWLAGSRFLLAGAILYVIARATGAPPPLRRHWLAAAGVGAVLLVGGNSSLVWAEQRVPSALAATILAMIPLWMVLLDSLRKGGPTLTGRIAIGLVIGLAGVGILVGPAKLWGSSRVDILGVAVLMFSAFCWAVGSLQSRSTKLPPSPFLAAAMEMVAGGAILIAMGILVEGRQLHLHAISTRSAAGLLYLVIFGSLVSFTAYIWLLGVVATSHVATYGYVNPAVAVALGWAFGGESISVRQLVATAIIVAAVVLILSHSHQPVAVAPDTEGFPTLDEERAMRIGE